MGDTILSQALPSQGSRCTGEKGNGVCRMRQQSAKEKNMELGGGGGKEAGLFPAVR